MLGKAQRSAAATLVIRRFYLTITSTLVAQPGGGATVEIYASARERNDWKRDDQASLDSEE